MEKRVISLNDIDDNIIRAVKAKHDTIEAIRQEKDAYINRVISDMKAEMTYGAEEFNSTIEEGEKFTIEDNDDPTEISVKLKILPFKSAKPAHDNAIERVLNDENLEKKIDEAHALILKGYRKAVKSEWNQRHPMLPGKLIQNNNERGKTHLWVRNKPEEEEEK